MAGALFDVVTEFQGIRAVLEQAVSRERALQWFEYDPKLGVPLATQFTGRAFEKQAIHQYQSTDGKMRGLIIAR